MNWIDIICAALILLIAFFGFMRGIVAVALHFAAYIGAFVGAKFASSALAGLIYQNLLQSKVLLRLRLALPTGSVEGGVQAAVQKAMASLPDIAVRVISFLKLDRFAAQGVSPNGALTVEQLERDYFGPILTKVLSVAVFVLAFLLLAVVLRLIAAAIDHAIKNKKGGVLNTVNRVLGGVFGLVKGLIPAGLACLVMDLLAPVINKPDFTALVQSSWFCATVAKIL